MIGPIFDDDDADNDGGGGGLLKSFLDNLKKTNSTFINNEMKIKLKLMKITNMLVDGPSSHSTINYRIGLCFPDVCSPSEMQQAINELMFLVIFIMKNDEYLIRVLYIFFIYLYIYFFY